jgi:hypothetical protein
LNDKSSQGTIAEVSELPPFERTSPFEVPMSIFRLELKAWLGRNAPSLEELYEGALCMLYSQAFPGRTRFIAHAAREIANRLPEAITGIKNERFEWQNKLDTLLKSWERAGFAIDGSLPETVTAANPSPSTEFPVPRRFMQEMAKLLSEYALIRETNQARARRLFEGVDTQVQGSREALVPIVTQWLEVTNWFVNAAHDSGRRDTTLSKGELEQRFELFETTLGALTREFFKTIGELDEILEKTNS